MKIAPAAFAAPDFRTHERVRNAPVPRAALCGRTLLPLALAHARRCPGPVGRSYCNLDTVRTSRYYSIMKQIG